MAELERLSVLIVEANAGMRGRLRTILNNLGITAVQFAVSAGAAVGRLRDRRYDLILCEYNLGDGQDGQHLLEDLRTREIIPADTLFIMITGERNHARIVGAAELAPDDYILKPLTPDTLRFRLVRALDRRDALRPVHRLVEQGDAAAAIRRCAEARAARHRYALDFTRVEAELHAGLGEAAAAETLYRDLLMTKPAPWARLGLAKALVAKDECAEAEALLSGLVAEHPDYVDAYDWLARVLEQSGRADEARDTLAAAVALSPHRIGRLRRFGSALLAAGDAAAAERPLAEVVRKGKHSDFRDPEDHVHLVRAQLGQGRVGDAEATIRDLERSMGGLAGTRVCSAVARAHYFNRLGAPERAQVALRAALDGTEVPELSAAMKQELAKACLDNGLEAEGSRVVMDILRGAADERTLETTRAMLRASGRADLAAELEQRVHREVKALIAAGAEMVRLRDYDGAVREMMSAAQKMPGNPHVLFNAALALLRHVEHRGWNERLATQARGLIGRARKLDPAHPRLDAITAFMQQLAKKYGVRQQ